MRTHIEKKTQIEAIRVAQTISNSTVDWTNSSVNFDMVSDDTEQTFESLQRQVVCLTDGGYVISERSYLKRPRKGWMEDEY